MRTSFPLMLPRVLAAAAAMGGCTANFWSLESGIEGGEVTGSIEANLTYPDGCDDLTLFALNDDDTAILAFSVEQPLAQMRQDRDRLRTFVFDEDDDFTLTVQTGTALYGLPCADSDSYGYYGYYGYYSYYGYYGYRWGEDPEVDRVFEYTSGSLRMTITARKRRWDYEDDPIHAKLLLTDVVLTEASTGAQVTIPAMMLKTYVYQWYWF